VDPGPKPLARWRPALEVLAVAAAVAVAHGAAVGYPFVELDDNILIYESPTVRAGLTLDGLRQAFRIDDPVYYFHPLTRMSLMLDAQLFGVDPRASHGGNVLLHGLGAVALFLLLARTTARRGASLLAALLWAVHPLTVEGVTWASERKAVLSTLLALLACHAWVAWTARPSRGRMAGVVALSTAAMLAKPSLVILPGLFLVLDAWPLGRAAAGPGSRARTLGRLLLEKWPLVPPAIAIYVLAALSMRPQTSSVDIAPLGTRVLHAVASLWTYLRAFAWPSDLAMFHPYPWTVPPAAFAAGLAAAAAMTAAAVVLAPRLPAVAFGWGWFLVALLPYLGVSQAGVWPAWADRFAHVPIMGLATAAAFALDRAREALPRARAVAGALAAAALLLLAGATRRQVATWRDSETLFAHTTRIEPGAYGIQFNYGRLLARTDRLAEARVRYEMALSVMPGMAPAHVDLGTILWLTGDRAGGEAHYRRALVINPHYADALYNLAELLWEKGETGEAREFYGRFLAEAGPDLAPQVARVRALLGRGP
jgi:tetratricopeptide (TPR) repeat protein